MAQEHGLASVGWLSVLANMSENATLAQQLLGPGSWSHGPRLGNLPTPPQSLQLAIPETYIWEPHGEPGVHIATFSPEKQVMPSNQRPRRLTSSGCDLKDCQFLLKVLFLAALYCTARLRTAVFCCTAQPVIQHSATTAST
jgi:hypothetical protein